MKSGVTVLARVDLRIDANLKSWAIKYARGKKQTLTDLVCELLEAVRAAEQKKQPGEIVEQF